MRAPDSNPSYLVRLMALALLMLAARPAIAAHHPKTSSSPQAPAVSSSAAAPAAAPNAAGAAAPVPSSASEAPEPVVTAVHVERVSPAHEHYPTLQFFKTNVGFIRGRIDLLRERPLPESGVAGAIDPRFLEYRRMIAAAGAASDSLTLAEQASRRWELFSNITDLGRLEDQLDLMDRQLADQKVRLAQLQRDFTGRQQTSLAVVLSGLPAMGSPSGVMLVFDTGDTLSVPLTAETCAALRRGGVLELCHRLVEPREQTLAITLEGTPWDAGGPGFVTIEPGRDQLSFLRLDLAAAKPAVGASSMAASRWVNDTGLEASRGPETQP